MIKKNFILLVVLLLSLNGCGYSPVFSKKINFSIIELAVSGDKKINKIIINRLSYYKETKSEKGMEGMLEKMSPTGKKVENFLGGGQQMAHDYHDDPELIKTLQEIINTPGYDPDSVREAQRQIIQMNQGLPRFPEA